MFNDLSRTFRRWQMRVHKPFGKSASGLAITLGDLDADLAQFLAREFSDVEDVQVVEGNLLDLNGDAIVSPANSFGNMGGGIDKAIDDFHQGAAQDAVRHAIAESYFGELPVGASLVVDLQTRHWPFIVVAPTMRIPGGVSESINAYLAMRASLVGVIRHNASSLQPIRSLVIPGLCTGVGGMSFELASRQMRAAYDNVIGGQWSRIMTPAMAPFSMDHRMVQWSPRPRQRSA